MKTTMASIRDFALLSLLLISPFLVLEILNTDVNLATFPFVLFLCLWLATFIAIWIFQTIKRIKSPAMAFAAVTVFLFVSWFLCITIFD